jgi:hypothetical protein
LLLLPSLLSAGKPWPESRNSLSDDPGTIQFYGVAETTVEILAIVANEEAQAWLDEEGTSTPGGGTG